MKLAFSTLPCADWSLEHTLQICNESGIGAIELRLGLNEWSNLDMTEAQIAHFLSALNEHQVVVSNLGTQVVIKNYDTAQMQQIMKCIKLAKALKTKGLRIMLGTYKHRYSDEVPAPDHEGIIQWLKEASAAAQKEGAEIWIETHNEFATGKALRELLDQVQMPNCKLLWDIIHPLELNESIEDTFLYMGNAIAHIHIKDGKPWADSDLANWEYTKLGEGIIPVSEIVGRLEKQRYQGYYSLEWESTWKAEIRGPGFEGETIIPQFAAYMRKMHG